MLGLRNAVRSSCARSSASSRLQSNVCCQRRLFGRSIPKHESNTATARADLNSSYANTKSNGSLGSNAGFLGGVAGGTAVFLLGYSWYYFSGAKSAINSLSQAKQYAESVTEKVKQKAPEPNQALKWLRETTQAYAGFIPGAKGYVDKAFDDLDRIYEKHGPQVDEIVSSTYKELNQVAKDKGASLDGLYAAWSVLENALRDIGNLSGDAANEIMKNHPGLQEKLGGSFESLQSLSQNLGSDAREEVNKTFEQVRQIFSKGMTSDAVQEAQRVIEEKVRTLRQKGDELWQKGLQQAQPYLDKNPQVKKLVEENQDALKKGNLSHLWAQVRNAVDTGSTQDLERFVQHSKEQIQSKSSGNSFGGSGGLGSIASSLGGGEIMSKIQTLAQMTQKNGKEAEDLLKGTIDDIKSVIQKRTEEAERLASKSSGSSN